MSPDWEKKVKTYSAMFKGFPELFDGQAGMTLDGQQPVFRQQRRNFGPARHRSVSAFISSAEHGQTMEWISSVSNRSTRIPSKAFPAKRPFGRRLKRS